MTVYLFKSPRVFVVIWRFRRFATLLLHRALSLVNWTFQHATNVRPSEPNLSILFFPWLFDFLPFYNKSFTDITYFILASARTRHRPVAPAPRYLLSYCEGRTHHARPSRSPSQTWPPDHVDSTALHPLLLEKYYVRVISLVKKEI